MSKLTKKAEALFRAQFTRNGKRICSGVHTDQGTCPLWGQIEAAGFVRSIPSVIGHSFNVELTDQGREFLDQPKDA